MACVRPATPRIAGRARAGRRESRFGTPPANEPMNDADRSSYTARHNRQETHNVREALMRHARTRARTHDVIVHVRPRLMARRCEDACAVELPTDQMADRKRHTKHRQRDENDATVWRAACSGQTRCGLVADLRNACGLRKARFLSSSVAPENKSCNSAASICVRNGPLSMRSICTPMMA
jgi:hypothetical protein